MRHEVSGELESNGVGYNYKATIHTGDDAYTYPDTAEVELDFGEEDDPDVDYDGLEERAIELAHEQLKEEVNGTSRV